MTGSQGLMSKACWYGISALVILSVLSTFDTAAAASIPKPKKGGILGSLGSGLSILGKDNDYDDNDIGKPFDYIVDTDPSTGEEYIRKEFAVSPEKAAVSPIPLPVDGSCTVGQGYLINSVWDLYDKIAELQCIFAAGESADAIPLGYNYGYMLAAANTGFFNFFTEVAYQGDFTVKTQCQGNYYTIGWMGIAGLKPGCAVWYQGKAADAIGKLADGEYPFNPDQEVIVMDFTVDFKELCPPEGNEKLIKTLNFSPFNNSIWPIKKFVDLAVIVGRDREDGGIITLNKAFVKSDDPAEGSSGVLFYATKSFDPDTAPNFTVDTEIFVPPVATVNGPIIDYYTNPVKEILERLDPFGVLSSYADMQSRIQLRDSGESGYDEAPKLIEDDDEIGKPKRATSERPASFIQDIGAGLSNQVNSFLGMLNGAQESTE